MEKDETIDPEDPQAGETVSLPGDLQQQILSLHSGQTEDRPAGIEELCRRHPRLATEIRGFIEALDRAEDRVIEAVHENLPAPEQIGPYRILSVLGEGGMGTVYIAEQKKPIRRRVALKVIKLGMDSTMVLRRFESERQALAMMEHSNIAKVFEAGATERGQPYFAMEYVKGKPITQYCDDQKLGLRERLDLFRQVCFGVHHAHQKGVIHRDLKPTNVLVSDQDGRPTAKIIDFGVARATDHRLVEATIFTEQGVIVGTPEYMSPEQAGLDALDIDTRSDIYALGVLLYELLVGELPFSPAELRQAGLREMERKIRDEDPPKPSTRLTTSGTGTAVAAQRRTDVSDLTRRVKGDLDWIAMKALEKNRTRRYQNATDLADDIQRHLDNEPVLASPPSAVYRIKKLMQRYRGGLWPAASAALVVTLLLIVVVGGGDVGNRFSVRVTSNRPDATVSVMRSQEYVGQLLSWDTEGLDLDEPLELFMGNYMIRVEDPGFGYGEYFLRVRRNQQGRAVHAPLRRTEEVIQDMIEVPAGTYPIGHSLEGVTGGHLRVPIYQEEREVQTDGFYIDKTEVSKSDYQDFVLDARHPAPLSWVDGQFPDGEGQLPVVDVSWDDARAYAEWAGKRLPTAIEWEIAARGTEGRNYSWGNSYDATNANLSRGLTVGEGPVPVGSQTEDESPFGVLHMVGNATEWVWDHWAAKPVPMGESSPATTEQRTLKGSSWRGPSSEINDLCAHQRPRHIGDISEATGFRCAKSMVR